MIVPMSMSMSGEAFDADSKRPSGQRSQHRKEGAHAHSQVSEPLSDDLGFLFSTWSMYSIISHNG